MLKKIMATLLVLTFITGCGTPKDDRINEEPTPSNVPTNDNEDLNRDQMMDENETDDFDQDRMDEDNLNEDRDNLNEVK